ncbi:MAG TPA: class I SAM-dependent methyltransferase [Dehalococcoidia bacterium]|nr:class I SAM-dependent methyltransferase [Dehalococcoidia bacterium]
MATQSLDKKRNGNLQTALIAPTIPEIRIPQDRSLTQDAEWIDVEVDGEWRRIRLHDYHELYTIPGLYEGLFNRLLKCSSPIRVVSLLNEVMAEAGEDVEKLRVLDLGAGSGLVGYELQNLNVEAVVGSDIIEEARQATLRDRPWCYDDYFVADFTQLDPETQRSIRAYDLNALTCVAALGFGDIPTKAFLQALDLISTPGWVAFNIKEAFVQEQDVSGFDAMIRRLAREDVIRIESYRRYQHRLSCAGEPLYYIAMAARKVQPVPQELLQA